MKEILEELLNRGPNSLHQVSTWLESGDNQSKRRYVGLLTQLEIDTAKSEFERDPMNDSCWGDRAFTMYPNKFNPR